jgi:hypothetical protein
MIGRIEETIDGRTAHTMVGTAASASPPTPEAGDQSSGWSFKDIVTLILNLGRDRSDPDTTPP